MLIIEDERADSNLIKYVMDSGGDNNQMNTSENEVQQFGEKMTYDKRTSVGGFIRQKTYVAMTNRPTGQTFNQKEMKAVQASSIIAFNNNFL